MRRCDDADVRAVDPGALVDAVDLVLADWGRGDARQLIRHSSPATDDCAAVHAMAAVVPRWDLAVAKWASFRPATDTRASQSNATTLISRASTGEPLAAIEGTAATLLRTAAATASVARRARPSAQRVALIGFGAVNREVLSALVDCLPELSAVTLITRLGGPVAVPALGSVRLTHRSGVPAVLDGIDLVVSATGAAGSLARLDDVDASAVVVALDGAAAWGHPKGPGLLSDHDDTVRPSLATAYATDADLTGARFVDLSGSALTDAALAQLMLAGVR